jgi:hypothetical protein
VQLVNSDVSMIDCEFIDNYVESNGALFLSCEGLSYGACRWDIDNVEFQANQALLGGGGAIFWKTNPPSIRCNVTYIDIQASYGDLMVSEHVFLHLANYEAIDEILLDYILGETFKDSLLFFHKDF